MSIPIKTIAVEKAPMRGEYPIDPPEIPESFVRRFPELAETNTNIRQFWHQVKNLLNDRQQRDISDPLNKLINEVDALKKQIANLQTSLNGVSAVIYDPRLQNLRTQKWHRVFIYDRNAAGNPTPPRIGIDNTPIP